MDRMMRKTCEACNRRFSNFTLHLNGSRCGRYQKGTMDDQDRDRIEKVGLKRAIRRINKK